MLDSKLTTLLKVNEKKNFTKAAKELSLTQPAVSHHITALEEELGVRIFNRQKGLIKLTAEGKVVVKYASRMQSLYEKMRRELQDKEKQITRLIVGITHTAESNLISEVLAQYSNQNDGVIITIITDTIQNLYDKLANYELDLAIVEGRVHHAGINTLLLDTDYLVCAVCNKSKLAKKSSVTLEEIQNEKMILRLPDSATRNLFVSHLESINRSIDDFNVILEVDNIATIKDLVRKNFGISILARSACLDEIKKKTLTVLPIENLSMIRETNILYHQDFSHPLILHEIIKIYKATAKLYV